MTSLSQRTGSDDAILASLAGRRQTRDGTDRLHLALDLLQFARQLVEVARDRLPGKLSQSSLGLEVFHTGRVTRRPQTGRDRFKGDDAADRDDPGPDDRTAPVPGVA